MMPEAYKSFAGSGLSSLFFGSNIWFFFEDSYTAEASALKPLLHTWTLSLEEQFYIIFPPLVYLIDKYAKDHLLGILFVMFLGSIILSQYMSIDSKEASFFMLHSRAWELLAGSILAYVEINYGRKDDNNLSNTLIPLFGMALILYSIITFTEKTHHPGFITLIPIVGTCAVIWYCNGKDLLSVVLKTKAFVGCGLISYSLYLWHFVIFAFARIRYGDVTLMQSLIAIVVSIIAAIVSYYIVEMPFRNRTKMPTKKVLLISGIGFTLLAAAYGYIYKTNGVSSRLGPFAEVMERSRLLKKGNTVLDCSVKKKLRQCQNTVQKPTGQIVLVGDSHALSLLSELVITADHNNVKLISFVAGGCPYLLNTYVKLNENIHRTCQKERAIQLRKSLSELEPSTVVYAANMPYWLESKGFDNREGGKVRNRNVYEITDVKSDLAIRKKNLRSRITETIKDIQSMGHKIVIVYPIPEAGWDVPDEVNKRLNAYPALQRMDQFKSLEFSISSRVARQRALPTEVIYNSIKDKKLVRIYPRRLLCDQKSERCNLINQSDLLFSDKTHVSPAGARIIVNEIARKLGLKP